MIENSYDNCRKMVEMAVEYYVRLYYKKHPDDERDLSELIGDDRVLMLTSVVQSSFLFYHQALRQSFIQKGIDIGDFPDVTYLDFETPPEAPQADRNP